MIVVSRSLFCDMCANWVDSDDPSDLAPTIRRKARRRGWTRRGGRDLCPTHTGEGPDDGDNAAP